MTPNNPDQVRIYEIKDVNGVPVSMIGVAYKFDGEVTISQQVDLTGATNEDLGAWVRGHLRLGADAPESTGS
tara:strand:- start:771 stop:986 length:216 start_codon:yes stop_codon:yes gene_type:complete